MSKKSPCLKDAPFPLLQKSLNVKRKKVGTWSNIVRPLKVFFNVILNPQAVGLFVIQDISFRRLVPLSTSTCPCTPQCYRMNVMLVTRHISYPYRILLLRLNTVFVLEVHVTFDIGNLQKYPYSRFVHGHCL